MSENILTPPAAINPVAESAARPAAKVRPKNWLMMEFRKWHIWLGVGLSLFIVLICATGIYLNHKDLFDPKKRAEKAQEKAMMQASPLRTVTDISALAISPAAALRMAQEKWGDVPIEKIELKQEGGALAYKIEAGEGRQLIVGAATGDVLVKDGYMTSEMKAGEGKERKGLDWGKFLKDLHTGKIASEPGKLFVDFTSLVVIGLTLSGLYLWAAPKIKKRLNAAKAATK